MNNFGNAANGFKKILFGPSFKRTVAVIAVLIIILAGSYYLANRSGRENVRFAESYRLVAEKISRSAAIRINFPPGLDAETVKSAVSFDPPIEGAWVEEKSVFLGLAGEAFGAGGEKRGYAAFKPNDPLKTNYHYAVTADLGGGKILKADFLAVEDPKIDAIFPRRDFEAPEDSKISVIFNRPVAPLTTLEESEKIDVPVEISPKTEGRFKWISTNTLQFIPKDRLKRSTNYSVKVGSGFVSMDGLPVGALDANFKTRVLRYLNSAPENNPEAVYNEPVRIYFNQPVDLERTVREITLTDSDSGKDAEFIAQYKPAEQKKEESRILPEGEADSGIFGSIDKAFASVRSRLQAFIGFGKGTASDEGSEPDKAVIEIFLKTDRFGRQKIWNLENNYRLVVKKAYPEEGDIDLEAEKIIDFRTTNIVRSFGEANGRTPYAGADLFDPQGQLEINFYEPIDIDSSQITASTKITRIEHGEKCSDPNFDLNDFNCKKIPDPRIMRISFDSGSVAAGETIRLGLERVYNKSGKKINAETYGKDIHVFRPLEFRVGSYDLSNLTICSNNPIAVPDKADFKNKITADKDYDIFSWGTSYLVTEARDRKNPPCKIGEFETGIYAGFMPETGYRLGLNLEDVFGNRAETSFEMTTGKMEKAHVNIFPMQNSFSVTSPQKRKLTFGAKNLTYVNVDICKLSALNFNKVYEKLGSYYNRRGSFDYSICNETRSKVVSLPERYWVNNYFDIDVGDSFSDPLGSYAIILTHPLFVHSDGTPVKEIGFLNVTNLAVAQKLINPVYNLNPNEIALSEEQLSSLQNLYWVSDMASLNPVSGAKVSLYDNNGSMISQASTNDQGVATMKPAAGSVMALVEHNGDSTIVAGYENRLSYGDYANNVKKIYIYTDKPLYRPGDTVNAKGILRLGYDGNYQMFEQKEVELDIFNPRYEKFLTRKVTLNDYGTFVAEFFLDANAPLGTYQICVKGTYNCGYFDLLEYAPASFKVSATADREEYISKDNVKINLEAAYYFGVPVENGQVEYTVSSQNYYFDKYRDGYLNFGYFEDCPSYYCYGEKFISRGAMILDKNGKGTISEIIDLQKIFDDNGYANSKIIVVDITVKNSLGQSVSTQKSFLVHSGEFYLGVSIDPSFVKKNEEFKVNVKAIDTQGKPKSAGKVAAEVYKTEWVYAKRLEVGGNFIYDWEKKRDLVKTGTLDDPGNGDYSMPLKLDAVGEYEIDVIGHDGRGNKILSRGYAYIHGPGAVRFRPAQDNELTLKTERTELKVGEDGSFVIESPYEKAKALIALERGKIFDYRIVDVNGGLYNYKFKAEEAYAPNIFASVLLQSADPAVRFGMQEFRIDSDKNKIDIEIQSDKKTYRPGEEVVLKISAKDRDNDPVSAEVSVAVVDLSVLALKGNPKKDPLIFFYNGFPLTVSTSSNLKSVLLKREANAEASKGGSGGGDGQGAKVRGVFKETAFWEGSVLTDSAGGATVKFKLPDNLTTWQAEALGVDRETKLGVDYVEFMAKKDLMIVPLKPRFILPGDVFYIGAQVFNQSDSKQKIRVGFASDTLEFLDKKKETNASLKKGESKTLYFKVRAPENVSQGSHFFTVSAAGGGLDDAVQMGIAVKPKLTFETVAAANYTSQDKAVEVVYIPGNVSRDAGSLKIGSSATLAVYLADSLNYLIAYPYGCSEQVASRLKSLAVVKSGLNVPNLAEKFKLKTVGANGKEYTVDELISAGLAKIYNNQNYSGGFGIWSSQDHDYYATLAVVDALNALKAGGIAINENFLKKSADYLYREFTRTSNNMAPDMVISAASVLLATDNYRDSNVLLSAVQNIANNDSLVNDRLGNESLAELAVLFANQKNSSYFAGKINTILDNRINIDSRGAFLQAGGKPVSPYETTIADTALYLRSLAAGSRETEFNDKVVRWLLNSRDRDGAWGSTKNTEKTINAFAEYLKWKKETQADYVLETRLNGKTVENYSFNSRTILDQLEKEIPVKDLKTNDYNYIDFSKKETDPLAKGSLYYDLSLKYYLDGIAGPRDEGMTITRSFYALDDVKSQKPLESAKTGDVFRAHLEIAVPKDRRNATIEDYIPAGLEIVDMNLATEQKSLRFTEKEVKYPQFYPEYKELRDDRAFAWRNYLEAGTYEFDYYVRALVKGKYLQLPAQVYEMYNPEIFGRTASGYFEVK